MPTIAIVDGIKIQMFYNDHAPAHFHAILAGQEVLIAISTLDVIRGALPSSRLRRILAWARDNQEALALNWLKCQEEQPPEKL
ncbi:MAG TPA: DUF4160 domain-containing protein [Acetobacteraceae bacterium]|jgi:hypothetical protein|nr:DUF4160 domain-containing protein [Acetobacteraceae bacterium]